MQGMRQCCCAGSLADSGCQGRGDESIAHWQSTATHAPQAVCPGIPLACGSPLLQITFPCSLLSSAAPQKYVAWRDDPHRATYAMRRHYRGAFADEMTKSEAARILGVRESADAETVQKKHRKLMILNHPDRGGSTFLAGKVNEAKQVLTGGSSATKAP